MVNIPPPGEAQPKASVSAAIYKSAKIYDWLALLKRVHGGKFHEASISGIRAAEGPTSVISLAVDDADDAITREREYFHYNAVLGVGQVRGSDLQRCAPIQPAYRA